MENLMKRALEAAGGYQGLEEVEKEEYRDWVEMGRVGEEVAQAAHLVWLGREKGRLSASKRRAGWNGRWRKRGTTG